MKALKGRRSLVAAAAIISLLAAAFVGSRVQSARGGPSQVEGTIVTQVISLTDEQALAPPSDTTGALDAQAALDTFANADPEFIPWPNATAQLGLYTAASSADTYRYEDQLAWGFNVTMGCPPSPNPADADKVQATTCSWWLLLDARTGELLEGVTIPIEEGNPA